MKMYAEFYHMVDGKMMSHLGSDSVMKLDGRKNVDSLCFDIDSQIEKMRRVKKVDGYKIIKASNFRDKGKLMYRSFPESIEYKF